MKASCSQPAERSMALGAGAGSRGVPLDLAAGAGGRPRVPHPTAERPVPTAAQGQGPAKARRGGRRLQHGYHDDASPGHHDGPLRARLDRRTVRVQGSDDFDGTRQAERPGAAVASLPGRYVGYDVERWRVRADTGAGPGLPQAEGGAGGLRARVCAQVGAALGYGAVLVSVCVRPVVARGLGCRLVGPARAARAARVVGLCGGARPRHAVVLRGAVGRVPAAVAVPGVRGPLQQCATAGRRPHDSAGEGSPARPRIPSRALLPLR
ncbi:unnamed protein product [Ixodes pacificus]